MNQSRKNYLTSEANQQMKALKLIGHWRTLAIAISAIGITLIYAGFGGDGQIIWMGVIGILLVVLGFAAAVVLNLGIRNGKRNVDKIVKVIESEAYGK